MAHRSRPHVTIPAGAAPPLNPSPSAHDQSLSPINLWADRRNPVYTVHTPSSPSLLSSSHPGPRISLDVPGRPPSRAASAYEYETSRLSFPEPQLHRSSSQRTPYRSTSTNFTHRTSRSESVLTPDGLLTPTQYSISGESSRPPSFFENTPESISRDLSTELTELSNVEEALRKFQAGELPDAEWYRLVSPSVREVLDKKEVQRQSILFEIIKSEKDYVADLELVKEVFIDPLMNTLAVPSSRVKNFIREVFFNFDEILQHHQKMLTALFARQREQHPWVMTVADIILDNCLEFLAGYEEYIKHYPIAEMRHRSEMRRNTKYQYLVQQCSLDPRVRKRDIITFISRPVTRLPRLQLLLDNARKFTEPESQDAEDIPVILGILNEFIRSTQPGIEAAEEKVKFWSLCESLVYQKGEIIDLDLYDDTRSLQYQGRLSRKYKSEMNYHWADLHVALLDNYLLLLKPDVRSNDGRANPPTRHHVVSRPIPIDYLRLGMFDGPPENRKEKAEDGGLGLLDRVRPKYRQMFPFTIYHASSKMNRRYTLYAQSEQVRDRWLTAFNTALDIRRYRQEGNMFFVTHVINDGFFKQASSYTSGNFNGAGAHFTGRINAAIKFSSTAHKFVAVASSSGVFVAQKGEPAFRKVLSVYNPTCLVALPDVNKFFVLHDQGLYAYSLDLVARATLGISSTENAEASKERIAGDVLFFRAGRVGSRPMVLYVAKSFLQYNLYALEVVNSSDLHINPRRNTNGLFSFRAFGEPVSIPKDTLDIIMFRQRIVICSDKGLSLVDPTNLSLSAKSTLIPDFSDADFNNNLPMMTLKSRCASSKPLGIVRCDSSDELLVIYDELGCYTNKYGVPSRSSGYLRWETKATSYSWRGEHILLFSPEFIEIRTVQTGKLVQVIEGADMRRVDVGLLTSDKDLTTLVAMKGREEQGLVVDTLQELVETTEIRTTRSSEVPGMFDDFEVM
ncbi:hypothetical protein OH76DRAFT_1476727 [Lentinus brumalis]|uniref:Dbl homology domain-containing protein n=1 Tax=Lentinus brumalis TaxID=2498619 RepID=A0A371DXT9_9APHY|nr:hypothetical protein OH76DRAFT_1476727 [Polyporus brumalis]